MISGMRKLCTYMRAFAGTLLFMGIWPLAHLFPPIAPATSSVEVAAYYREYQPRRFFLYAGAAWTARSIARMLTGIAPIFGCPKIGS